MTSRSKLKLDPVLQLFADNKIGNVKYLSDMARAEINDHVVIIHSDGRRYCDCIGYLTRINKQNYMCKHLKALQMLIDDKHLEVKNMPKLPTTFPNFNKLTEGGIPEGDMTLFAGTAATGKTKMVTELSVIYLKSHPDKNVLMILTEEKMTNTLNVDLSRLKDKHGLEKLKRAEWTIQGGENIEIKPKSKETVLHGFTIEKSELNPELLEGSKLKTQYLITAFLPNIYDIMTLLGSPGVFQMSEGDEKGYQRWIDLRNKYFVYHVNRSELAKFIERYNIGLIVIDSITYPIKRKFTLTQSNYPARASLYGKMLGNLMEMCSTYETTIICVGHAVPSGASPFASPSNPDSIVWGGMNVLHSFKYVIQIRKMVKKLDGKAVENWNTKRRFFLARWATKPEFDEIDSKKDPEYIVLQLTDDGWIDPLQTGKTVEKVEVKKEIEKETKPKKKKIMKRKKVN